MKPSVHNKDATLLNSEQFYLMFSCRPSAKELLLKEEREKEGVFGNTVLKM